MIPRPDEGVDGPVWYILQKYTIVGMVMVVAASGDLRQLSEPG